MLGLVIGGVFLGLGVIAVPELPDPGFVEGHTVNTEEGGERLYRSASTDPPRGDN